MFQTARADAQFVWPGAWLVACHPDPRPATSLAGGGDHGRRRGGRLDEKKLKIFLILYKNL